MRRFQASVREVDRNWILTDVVTADSRREAERIACRMYRPHKFTRADVAVRPLRAGTRRQTVIPARRETLRAVRPLRAGCPADESIRDADDLRTGYEMMPMERRMACADTTTDAEDQHGTRRRRRRGSLCRA